MLKTGPTYFCLRIIPNIISLSMLSSQKIFYFHPIARHLLMGADSLKIILELRRLILIQYNYRVSTDFILYFLALIFLSLAFRLIYNDYSRSINALYNQKQSNSIEKSASMTRTLELATTIIADNPFAHFIPSNKDFPSKVDKIEYLFNRIRKKEKDDKFMIAAYEMAFILLVGERIPLRVLILLAGRINRYETGFIERSVKRKLLKKVEKRLKEDYITQDNQKSRNDNIIDDQSNKRLSNENLNIYEWINILKIQETVLSKMQTVISGLATFLRSLKSKMLTSKKIHKGLAEIKQLKAEVDRNFTTQDKQSNQHYTFHLLPYALYLETIKNDRGCCQYYLRQFTQRAQLNHHSRTQVAVTRLDLSTTCCLSVEIEQNGLGSVLWSSDNCRTVLGRNFNTEKEVRGEMLVSTQIRKEHQIMVEEFVRGERVGYLGSVKRRIVSVPQSKEFRVLEVVVKMAPAIDTGFTFLVSMAKSRDRLTGGASSKEGCLVINESLEIVAVNRCADMDWAFNELTLRTSKYCLNNFSNTLHKHCIKVIRETIDQALYCFWLSTQFTRSTLQTSIRNPLTGIRHKCTVGLEMFCYPNLQSNRTSSNHPNEPIVEIVLHIKRTDPKLEPENMPEQVGGTQSEDSFDLNLNKKEIMNFRTEAEEKPVVRTLFSPNSFPSKSTTRMVDSSSLRLLSFAGSKKSPLKQIIRSSEVSAKEVNKEDIGKDDSINESSLRNNNYEKVKNIEHISNTQQTGRGSDSTIAQISLKSKINHVIDKQEKLYVRSELFCMVLLQILIWSMSIFSTVYMNNKSNIEMQKMIEVRSGFAIIIRGFSNMFNSGTMLLNHMFVQRGYISTTKYSQFNKSSQTNFLTEAEKSIQRSTDASRQLKKHIFSFDIHQASKFLKRTAK